MRGSSSSPSAPRSNIVVLGPNGSSMKWLYVTENMTIAAAATSTSAANLLPSNSRIMAVAYRVTTVIPTAATFEIGVTGDVSRFGTGVLVAAGTTGDTYSLATPLNEMQNKTATQILITPNLTPAAATGRVRIVVWYMIVNSLTS